MCAAVSTESQTFLLLSISTKQPSTVLCIRKMDCERKIGQSKPTRIILTFHHSLGPARKLIISGFVKFGVWIANGSSCVLNRLLILINNNSFFIVHLISKERGLWVKGWLTLISVRTRENQDSWSLMNPGMGNLAVGGAAKGCLWVYGLHCLHRGRWRRVCSNSLVFKDHYSATDHSFVSKIGILVFKISSLFIIVLRYPEHFRVVHGPRDVNEEKEGKTVKPAASPLPLLSSERPGGQKHLPEQTGSEPQWGAGWAL